MSETFYPRLGPLGVAALLLLGACAPPDHVEVTHTRTVNETDRAVPGVSMGDRFGRQMGPASAPQPGGESLGDALRKHLRWDVPKGWEELEAGGMRLASLRPAGDADADCSLIILEGQAGGLLGNVNRWRGQLGLPDLAMDEVMALPSLEMLGAEGLYCDFTGTYTGMGGQARENWRMLGVILANDDAMLFMKMTGPADLLEAERARFEGLCGSLRLDMDDAPPASAPSQGGGAGPLTYDVPAGWNDVGAKSMRAVNLTVGDSQCYVILLGGQAGGLLGNLNRWRGEVGLPDLVTSDLDELAKVRILGEDAPLLDVRGDYKGMGEGGGANYRLLGVPLIRDSVSVFVKMVGPEEQIEAQRAGFLAFVASLGEGR
ncbi:MAG: hypothetical protein H6828_14800 [Planctomycetes bacterium]|nr:hypothetical protein [Planctomycetota bacterium]